MQHLLGRYLRYWVTKVSFEVPEGDRIIKELWRKRLFVYPSAIPNIIRFVVGPHITYEHIDEFVSILAQVVDSVK